ncbi:hypothetical protein [Ramlibacter tataouinensis]|uniref:Uncharacterized protein n=1 Tax=Ramlibacter tataouinensis (strain ATCC BAA-407 / DSM 14655 / LMG 21543 / TTB310) TaxID=365046 RepID=F5Y5Z7_RAMTT|nr:hypothetical protein [Ramlibacter tataouinensis]AEG91501.1 Hypothetical protein Rta_04300 [Ramlibacter tataouinensis TTB310]
MDTVITPSTDHQAPRYADKTDPVEHQRQHGRTAEDMSHIPGWGADLDRANRPAVPMERTPPRLDNVHWDAPAQQQPKVKVYHSIERPGITPVFGTSAPPAGLSGKLRDVAYRFSENDIRHWMILLAADRVNVGEGLLSDLAHGHIPNILGEMGAGAEWRHNRAGFVRKAVVASAAVGLAVYLLRRRR